MNVEEGQGQEEWITNGWLQQELVISRGRYLTPERSASATNEYTVQPLEHST